jgi:bacterioferritin-associated ferredoxin
MDRYIYIARLLDDVDFPDVIRLSGVQSKCSKCLNSFDQNRIRRHREICLNEESDLEDYDDDFEGNFRFHSKGK